MVCFNANNNPAGRRIERETIEGKTKTRYWYAGLGCSVIVAAMYLVRAISDAAPPSVVRLFEGFVSYKDASVKTDHLADVRALREVVRDPIRFSDCIVSAANLREHQRDKIISAFEVCGVKAGVPAVIKGAKAENVTAGSV
ncbi:MAG: hypothetical protein ACLPX7_06385 [Xanthobacteraceae bacterium]